MRPAHPVDEAKFPPQSLSGNRRRKLVCWLATITLLAALHASAQSTSSDEAGEQLESASAESTNLPDSPGTVWADGLTQQVETQTKATQPPSSQPSSKQPPNSLQPLPTPPCPAPHHRFFLPSVKRDPCDPYRPFVEHSGKSLTPTEKGYLAIHDVTDPFNLLTIVATSAFTIGSDSYTAFGPGMRGFGLNVGTSLSQDVTGEVIGTFGACSLLHEDPRYFRMPGRKPLRRLLHAISQVAIAQGDNGRPMPNYANFITAVAASEIANQYVPGIATDLASTTERIFTGFLTEPIGNIVAEFLPDIASRIHIRVVLVQRLLNQISAQPSRTGISGENPF